MPEEAKESAAPPVAYPEDVQLLVGEIDTISVHGLTRLSLNDPAVADILNADDKEISLIAKGVGQTALFIWDERGKHIINIQVFDNDLKLIKERIQKLLLAVDVRDVTLDVNEKEGKLVVSGDVPSEKKEAFDRIIAPFERSLINFTEAQPGDLIQIDMQITELSSTLLQNLGFDWSAGASGGTTLTYPETLPALDGSVSDYFKIGDFSRTSALLATINWLIQEGKGRVLSKPRLVVVNGQEASFLVGGEIPFRTTTTTGSTSQENIEFKSYGISLTTTPTIRKGKVDLTLNIEISEVDSATTSSAGVAFVTRSATTKLLLDDRQTIVLAGLIKKNESEKIRKVPILGDIPILSLVFKKKENPVANQDTELVISLTPTILPQSKPGMAKEEKVAKEEPQEASTKAESSLKPSMKEKIKKTPTIPKEMSDYIQGIQEKISQAIIYPEEAREYGWEGTVKLGLLILQDGTLAYALIKESSGYPVFDDNALQIAKNLAPYESFPSNASLQELNVTIPIIYSLKRN